MQSRWVSVEKVGHQNPLTPPMKRWHLTSPKLGEDQWVGGGANAFRRSSLRGRRGPFVLLDIFDVQCDLRWSSTWGGGGCGLKVVERRGHSL